MKIRTQLNLTIIGIIAAAILGFVYFLADEIRPRYREAQEEVLVDFAETMAALVSQTSVEIEDNGQPRISAIKLVHAYRGLQSRALKAQIYALNKTQVDTRIYVTDRQGKVIFDSDNDRDLGENYANWRDVKLALQGKYGARTTSGDPMYMEGSTMYVARPIMYAGDIVGALAVGKPTRNLDLFIHNLTNGLWMTGLVVALIFALAGYMVYRSLTKPLAKIQQYALDVSRGIETPRPTIGDNEIGDVEKALDEMRRSLDGKQYIETYIQSLTHQLKAPVAGIYGAAELLREDLPPVKRNLFLRNILGQSHRLRELIERLLALAQIENAGALNSVSMVRVQQLFDEVTQSLADQARSYGVSLRAEPSKDTVMGDQFLLTQALINLVKNAIEHATRGTEITLRSQQQSGQVVFSVTNIGEPVPDFALSRVFERFYSLPNTRGQKGSGIGLSFVSEIAKLHHGTASLQNEGEGRIVATLSVSARTLNIA